MQRGVADPIAGTDFSISRNGDPALRRASAGSKGSG
jgi:hypothetical protein